MLDKQAMRVYGWEWACENYDNNPLGKKACRDYIVWACGLYDTPPPSTDIFDANYKAGSSYNHDTHHIRLVRRHRTGALCLHEAAHAIIWRHFGATVEDHGPEWLGIYCYLLARAKIAHAKWIEQSLQGTKLRAWPAHKASPKALIRRAKKKSRSL